MTLRSFITIILVFACVFTFAQDSTKVKPQTPKTYLIETADGVSLTGTLVREDAEVIVLNTKSLGEVTIQKNKIKVMKELGDDSFVKGSYWFENPNHTRYVIGPSAFPLKKGEGYYQNLYLFAHSFNYGITDNISIGGGTEIATLIFAQEPPSLFFLTPKVGFDITPKFKAGAGVLYIHLSDFFMGESGAHYGIAYGLGTLGTKNNNFTLGLGWGFHSYKYRAFPSDEIKTDRGLSEMPIITFSGMARLARRFALTSENWLFPVEERQYSNGVETVNTMYQFIFSYGMRFMGEKMAVDFGFFNTAEIAENIIIGVPYIDFTVNFGGNKGRENKKEKKK